MRTLLSGFPIRALGRQDGAGRRGGRAAGYCRRSVTRILLVGCGKMGGALLAGWLEQGISPSDALIVDPHYDPAAGPAGVRALSSPQELPADFTPDVVLLAVKPQTMDEAAYAYRRFAGAAVF